MIVPDANLLLYAYDSKSPFFETAKDWWQRCLNGSEPVGLCHAVTFAFLRIGTNPRVFENPMTLETAAGHIASWHARSVTRVMLSDGKHEENVLALLKAAGSAGGNLVTDAQIAALAMDYRATVHTADQDFHRFPELRCHYPLQA